MEQKLLNPHGTIPTSGARAVEPFTVDGLRLLAVPQLAYDIPGTPADMNGGDSDTELLVLVDSGDGYVPFQRLPAPGGEDAEFFHVGDRAFLATASIRAGRGPYRFTVPSRIFEWRDGRFELFQEVEGFAAKQWRHFVIDGRHFLALAQGVVRPQEAGEHDNKGANRQSLILSWDGSRFAPFQEIASEWGYNWHAFSLDGQHFLAHADHVGPSVLHRWNGRSFEPFQELADRHGRAFADFEADGDRYLLVARLQSESHLLRWDGERFVEHQELEGLGAREFTVLHGASGLHVVRVNFVLGTPAAPVAALNSQVYRWQDGKLAAVEEFATSGATDVAAWHDAEGTLVAVSNSLTADIRFGAATVLYRFTG